MARATSSSQSTDVAVPLNEEAVELVHLGIHGACYTKHDDLHLHRTRQQILTKVIEEDLTVLVEGRTGITWFLGTVEGTVAGTPFAAPTALHPHLDPRRGTTRRNVGLASLIPDVQHAAR